MVEYQENNKNMENLNIIIEINEDGEMTNFDIALRNTELPYKNTDEYEYIVEEFEKVKEVNHKKFRCLLARELNCFACTAIYRFQLIFVRRKRKTPPIIEYVPAVRNRVQTPITTQTSVAVRQQTQQPIIKLVPKVVTPIVQNNVKTYTPVTNQRMVTMQQQINVQQKQTDASWLRQMLEKRGTAPVQQSSQQRPQTIHSVVKKSAVSPRIQATQARRSQAQIVPDVGSSEEDIETEVIDSSMVEVQMETNSNSPQPATLGINAPKNKTISKVVVKREPNVTVEDVKSQVQSTALFKPEDSMKNIETNTFKCDLCKKEFHSLRQRQRHQITHLKEETLHTCKICSKTFLNKDAAINHEKTHTKKPEPTNAKTTLTASTGKRNSRSKNQSDESQEESIVEEETVHDDNVIYMDASNE